MALNPAARFEIAEAFGIEFMPVLDSDAIEELCMYEVKLAGEFPGVLEEVVEFEGDVWRHPGWLDGA